MTRKKIPENHPVNPNSMWHHRWYNRLAIGFGLLLLMQGLVAQDKPEPSVLTPDDLIRLVLTRHPVARQADLQIRRGAATRLAARGGFDPKLYADLDQKYFDDKSYFSHLEGGMKVPAWFGAEVKAGFEQYSGSYLNPERTVPAGGLVAAGVNLSLGQGLWIDQRRATLFTARLYQQATVVERQLILNDLLFDATSREELRLRAGPAPAAGAGSLPEALHGGKNCGSVILPAT